MGLIGHLDRLGGRDLILISLVPRTAEPLPAVTHAGGTKLAVARILGDGTRQKDAGLRR
jgi:hypothetical protein